MAPYTITQSWPNCYTTSKHLAQLEPHSIADNVECTVSITNVTPNTFTQSCPNCYTTSKHLAQLETHWIADSVECTVSIPNVCPNCDRTSTHLAQFETHWNADGSFNFATTGITKYKSFRESKEFSNRF